MFTVPYPPRLQKTIYTAQAMQPKKVALALQAVLRVVPKLSATNLSDYSKST